MKKVVLTYGLISGALIVGFVWTMTILWANGIMNHDSDYGELIGYSSMLIALSMVFFGIKSYRDNQNGKKIGFWKGAQIGILISLLASVMYAAGWEAYLQTNPTFMDQFVEKYIEKLKAKGTPAQEVEEAIKSMATVQEMYKNPLIRFGMTISEILPVGIIVTLVSAGILRRKEVLAE
jgi:Protein of unknown function (DUF4199)